jgi:DNA-binding transcriptional LysR family regulator
VKTSSSLDLDGLRGFVAVAQRGAFHEAAIDLNVSASALTRRVQRLETALGNSLFERSTRRVTLTPVGKLFLPYGQRVLQELDAAQRAIGASASTHTGQVTVACIPTMTRHLLPRIIRDYRERRPETRIRMLEGNLAAVANHVREGFAELGLTFFTQTDADLVFDPLVADPYCLACPADHPLAALEQVSWEDLKPHRLIISGRGSGNRMVLDAALADLNWQPEQLIEIEHLTTSLGLAEAGLGIAVMPESVLAAQPLPQLALRRLVRPGVTRSLGVIRRKGVTLAPVARHFLRTVRGMAPALGREFEEKHARLFGLRQG